MDEKMMNLFKSIDRELDMACAKGMCDQCAFNCNGFCGTNVIQSVMAKLAGAKEIGLKQHHHDMDLINFIVRNEQRK